MRYRIVTLIYLWLKGLEEVRILPLHMLERSNRRQMHELFKLLRKNGQVVAWYLESIIFPEHLRFQEVKLMSSGQDLGPKSLLNRLFGALLKCFSY